MKVLDLTQGTPEWKQHRFNSFNASEAASMLGLDPKMKRNELLRIKATGSEKEFSDYVQNMVFEKGHEVEAMARPIIEKLIGDTDLYPVTGVSDDGKKSASFDGLTFMEDIAFEHKQWNEDLANLVLKGDVPDTHMPQLQQQLMISGADYVIFVVSDGTPEKMVWTEVYPDDEWFDRINSGWDQFEKDLRNYEHKEYVPEPVASAIQELPSVFVSVSGSVDQSNLPMVEESVIAFVKAINTDLSTDEDFVNADATCKFCSKAEKELEQAKKNILSQTETIEEAMHKIDFLKEELRQKRLMLEKLVKTKKQQIKDERAIAKKKELELYIEQANKEINPCLLPKITADFHGAMKGLKNLESLDNAVDTCLANAKIEVDGAKKLIRGNLDFYEAEVGEYGFLFNDLNQIIMNDPTAFQAIVKNRIIERKQADEAKMEAERQRIKQQDNTAIKESEDDMFGGDDVNEAFEQVKSSSKNRTMTPFNSWWITTNFDFDSAGCCENKDFVKMVAEIAFLEGMKQSK